MYIQKWGIEDWKKENIIESIKDENEKYLLSSMFQEFGNEMVCLSSIEIETINRCNNDCSFCPVSRGRDVRELCYMEEELFQKIIDDLANMDYSGVISLFSNNEPLIDKRFWKFLSYAKEKLPNATHALFTNGLLLNHENYIELIKKLDYLVIDNYNDNLALNPTVQEIFEASNEEYYGCKVLVQNRKKNQILLNRGTLSPNQEKEILYSSPCILPYIQMVVRPDGKVSRCCQDAYGNETMGDLNVQTILEVWNGSQFSRLRKHLLENRGERSVCNNCDVVGLTNYFPSSWWNLYYNQFLAKLVNVKANGKKIVLYNYAEAAQLIKELKRYGISIDYVVIDEEIEEYVNQDFYIVMDRYVGKQLAVLVEKGMKAIQNFIVCQPIFPTGLVRNINDRQSYIDKILGASANGSLVLCGAGETARMLVGYYGIKPCMVVDNYKKGNVFEEKYVVQGFEDVRDVSHLIFLIAVSDYYPVIEQLRSQGVLAKNIVIGINLV